jgi:hypothetical protein
MSMRLYLVGDDDVLDVLAELSRHLDYFEIARLDELPDAKLSADDHVVISFRDEARGLNLLAQLLAHSSPGFAGIVPDENGDSEGARAIVVAAELVSAIHDRQAR